jgi:hypothetical protein
MLTQAVAASKVAATNACRGECMQAARQLIEV